MKYFIVLSALLWFADLAGARSVEESIQFLSASPDFVELIETTALAIDLRYAGTNNFVGKDMYGKFKKAYLHKDAASKLDIAVKKLQKTRPGYKLVILDALRPRSVQWLLWEFVKGTAKEPYVANPIRGSVHNFGMAVDLSISDPQGRELDMGTDFDDFSQLSQPKLEERFYKERKLTLRQINNRKMLREIMTEAGFIQLPIEWWHYDALPMSEVKRNYIIIE